MSAQTPEELAAALSPAAREIEEFVHGHGWNQPVQVLALVPTQQLLEAEPGLADQLDAEAPLTPIAQESLPSEDLGEALARIGWPEQVAGCAVVQEIVVLPPEAEEGLPNDDDNAAREAASSHPDRREARLVAAVLRDGTETCVLRLRPEGEASAEADPVDHADEDADGEVIQDASLAPNLLHALHDTFAE